MGTGLSSSSSNMDTLLIPLFTRAIINNTIHFLTSTHKYLVGATGVRWQLSPVSPLNISFNTMMMYDPTSLPYSRPDVTCFLVPWRLSKKISRPLKDPANPIDKASPVMIYSIFFNNYCTWAYYSNTLSASKRTGTLKTKSCLVNCPIFLDTQDVFQTIQIW